MTSKKQKSAGYLLPEQIADHDLIDVCLKIPNVREYRAAFAGALATLQNWWSWDKSYEPGDTRATEAAQYWRNLLLEYLVIGCEGGGESMFDVRQDGCELEKTTDGETWSVWANLRRCMPALRRGPGGNLEWFDPDTEIWQPLPDDQADPREWPPEPPPATPPDQTARCLAAENIAAFMKLHTLVLADLTQNGLVIAVVAAGWIAGMAGALFMPALAPAAIATLILALGTVASAGFRDRAWSFDYNELKCFIYDNLPADGEIDADAFDALVTAFDAQPGEMYVVASVILDVMGLYGVSKVVADQAIKVGDCGCVESTYYRGARVLADVYYALTYQNFCNHKITAEGDLVGVIFEIVSGPYNQVLSPIPVTDVSGAPANAHAIWWSSSWQFFAGAEFLILSSNRIPNQNDRVAAAKEILAIPTANENTSYLVASNGTPGRQPTGAVGELFWFCFKTQNTVGRWKYAITPVYKR